MFSQEGHQGQARAFGAVDDPTRDPAQGAPFAVDQQTTAADRPSRGRPPAWLIIVLVLGLVAVVSPWALPHGVEIAAVSIVTLLLVLVLVRPQWALFVFILALPLHNLMMALLFHLTGSVPLVKLIQPWKEIVLGLALVRALVPMASRWLRRQPETSPWLRVTPLDIVAALLIVITAISVILPNHLVPLVGRLYGFRDLNMPLVAFAVGRLAPLSRRELKTLVALVAVDVVAFAVGAVGERVLWGNGLFLAVDYGTYIRTFLGQTSPLPHNTPWTFYAAGYFPRAGSLAVGPLDVSILVLIALPLLIIAGGRGREIARRWSAALGLTALLGGVALVLAFGRESLLLVVLECALVLVFMRPRWQWKGVALTLAGGVLGGALLLAVAWFVVQAPNDDGRYLVANTGLVSLLANTSGSRRGDLSQLLHQSTSANNPSTVSHLQSLVILARVIVHHPQGYGIGTSGQVGTRFATGTSGGETSYLSVGGELGVVGLLLYLAAFISAVFVCWRAADLPLSLLHR